VAAAVAVLAVLAVLAFCGGQALLAVAAVAAVVGLPRRTVSSSSSRRRPNPLTVPLFSSRTGTAIDHP
jgi:Flp pilus assembly protein TadB